MFSYSGEEIPERLATKGLTDDELRLAITRDFIISLKYQISVLTSGLDV